MTTYFKRTGFLLTSFLVLLVGCGPHTSQVQSAQNDFAKIRDNFLSQQGFSFQGNTRLLTGTTSNQNLVNFSGKVNGKDTLLDVKISMPEERRAKSVSLLSKNQKLYANVDGQTGWHAVDANNQPIKQEFTNWDPKFGFQQMDKMAAKIVPLSQDTGKKDIKAIKVVLDSAKLKSWLAEQMKKQSASVHVHSKGNAHQPYRAKIPFAFTLSDGQLSPAGGASIKRVETDIKDVISSMELEAVYTVYYNQTSMLPTNMVMNIRSRYIHNSQRINEYSEVQTYLMNYGRQYTLPDPTK
jgi:hypothetical protein